MIDKPFDIPINKALVAVEKERNCIGCCFKPRKYSCSDLACSFHNRKDGKDVIYKLVDYRGKQ